MPEQEQRQRPLGESPWARREVGLGAGPQQPKIEKPGVDSILKKLQKVERDSARKYKQRAGE